MQKTVRKIFDTFCTIISLNNGYCSSIIWNIVSLDSLQMNTQWQDLLVDTTVKNAFWQAIFRLDPDCPVMALLDQGADQTIGTWRGYLYTGDQGPSPPKCHWRSVKNS